MSRVGAAARSAAARAAPHRGGCVAHKARRFPPARGARAGVSDPATRPWAIRSWRAHRFQELAAAFGPAAIADVVLAVQAECDTQGLRMLQRFLEARRVAAVAADAARHQSGVGGARGEGPDPRWAAACGGPAARGA
jgi:hypothetical protein